MTIARPDHDTIVRVPMSWEDYLALDEPCPSEYYGGALVVKGGPTRRHQTIIGRLLRLLYSHSGEGTHVLAGWGWSPVGVRELLIPDVMVFDDTDDEDCLSGTPRLVIEVLSTNRSDDLMAKMQRYARWGAPDYWVVDPRDGLVLTYGLHDGIYVEAGRFTSGDARLTYGDVEVPVDIDELLAD